MDRNAHTNAPTAAFIRSMREVTVTLSASSASLFNVAMRLAEAGLDTDASHLIGLAKSIQMAEDKVRRHAADAGAGRIVKLSKH